MPMPRRLSSVLGSTSSTSSETKMEDMDSRDENLSAKWMNLSREWKTLSKSQQPSLECLGEVIREKYNSPYIVWPLGFAQNRILLRTFELFNGTFKATLKAFRTLVDVRTSPLSVSNSWGLRKMAWEALASNVRTLILKGRTLEPWEKWLGKH